MFCPRNSPNKSNGAGSRWILVIPSGARDLLFPSAHLQQIPRSARNDRGRLGNDRGRLRIDRGRLGPAEPLSFAWNFWDRTLEP